MTNKVIFLMGPTATGKTETAVELALHYDIEIISVDSALVYKGMDIGTAKPAADMLAQVPHHLIDIIEPNESFSVAEFCQRALKLIDEIHNQGKIPLLVGGTMMYFRALQYGLSQLPQADPVLRQKLDDIAAEKGRDYMHDWLARVDVESASRIHKNDPQRVQRALEVYELTGIPLSVLQKQQPKHAFPYSLLKMVLCYEQRQHLVEPIRQRFLKMLDAGLIDEVNALRSRGDLTADMPSIRSVGYRQVWEYLDKLCDYEEMIDNAVKATKSLAKRQYTWLRMEEDVNVYHLEHGIPTEQILQKVKQFIVSG